MRHGPHRSITEVTWKHGPSLTGARYPRVGSVLMALFGPSLPVIDHPSKFLPTPCDLPLLNSSLLHAASHIISATLGKQAQILFTWKCRPSVMCKFYFLLHVQRIRLKGISDLLSQSRAPGRKRIGIFYKTVICYLSYLTYRPTAQTNLLLQN
jgi:hypothetical protein